MKNFIVLILLSLGSLLCAHDHSIALAKGQGILEWNIRGGGSQFAWDGYYDQVDGKVVTYYVNVANGDANAIFPGDALSFEYALAEGWSLGLKSTAIQCMVSGLRDGIWQFDGSMFSNLRLTEALGWENTGFEAFWYEEVEVAPLWTNYTAHGNGMINLYSAFSVADQLLQTQGFSLSSYLDAKVTANFPSPFVTNLSMIRANSLNFLDAFQIPYEPDFVTVLVPTFTPYIAVGLEAQIGRGLNLSLGYNVPLGTLIRTSKSTLAWNTGSLLFLSAWGIEFQIKWVL